MGPTGIKSADLVCDRRARTVLPHSEIWIERTLSRDPIYQLCTHPRIWPQVTDDHIADPKDWTPAMSESMRCLVARDARGIFGFGIFLARNWSWWDTHTGFLPRSYGADALMSFQKMIGWMWQNTSARRLTGDVLRSNTLAIRFARRAGFEVYGINRRSKLVGGVLRDQVCLGISKPE
jgi:hypothetical protein